MKLNEYIPTDEKECMLVFESNVPLYFAPQERNIFQSFLQKIMHPYSYYVIRDNHEKVIACGGIRLRLFENSARLRWDMVAREFQNKKIGTFLTLSRLYRICQYPEIQMVGLCTSQHSYRFYEKMGFSVQKIVPDGIVPGMDEYHMELKLDDKKKQEIEDFIKRESFL